MGDGMSNELIDTMREFGVEARVLGPLDEPDPASSALAAMLEEIHRLRGALAAVDVEKNISVVCGKCNGQWYWPLTRGELVLDPAEVVCVSCYGAWDVSPAALADAPEGGE